MSELRSPPLALGDFGLVCVSTFSPTRGMRRSREGDTNDSGVLAVAYLTGTALNSQK